MNKFNMGLVIISVSILLFACDKKTTVSNETIPFQLLATGQTSGYALEKEQAFLITSPKKLENFLTIHNQSEILPNVNFAENAVVAIVDKNHSSGGYNLILNKVLTSTQGTEIFVTREVPGINCMTTMILTQPYLMVTADKSNLSEPVVIHLTENEINC